jgi:hypothetical protein
MASGVILMDVPLTADDRAFLKAIYQKLQDRPLLPGDPLYEPIYEYPGCDDPVAQLERRIEYADTESLSLFSGFRGSGKTTELFRLRQKLEVSGALVLYADALEYLSPAAPIEISDLLISLAGAFGDALEEKAIDIRSESYWARLQNWLSTIEVNPKEIDVKAYSPASLKLELKSTPSFRQKLAKALENRIGELRGDVLGFFEDGVKAIREFRGNVKVVFIFDSLEQIRGSLSTEQEVTRSIETLFSAHLRLLEIPYVHIVYTVPPWLKFVLPGADIVLLPCLRLWDNNPERSGCEAGATSLYRLVERRFTLEGLTRFFGANVRDRLVPLLKLSGGHFRDLLLLLRETVLRTDSLPVPEKAVDDAILRVKSNFLPIPLEDAKWLADIEFKRETLLKTSEPAQVGRLTRFLDTHVVLYLRNGEEWYDVHPLVRDEVIRIAKAGAEAT